jgi:chromosome segregation ATPase
MTDLKTALDRLNRAVDRLEGAAAQCLDRTDEEKRRLTAELKILHAEYAGLSGVTEQVSRHLDDTISRLETVIGDQDERAASTAEIEP